MKNLHLFTGYKKNSELCVPSSTASKRRCKHRPCGSFFVLFLIFVLFLVSSCGGESPSSAPKAAGDTTPITTTAETAKDPYVPNEYYDSVKFDFSKLDNSADITRITLTYTLTRGTYGDPFADTASSDFSTSDSNYILQGLTPNTPYYYRLTVTRGDATKDVTGGFTTIATVDEDDDGLIDIYNVAQLHNMRYNLEGTGYKTADDDATNSGGCPGGRCRGYELKNNLTFDRAGSKSGTWSTSDSVNGTIYTLDASDNAATYFVVDENNTGGWKPIGFATISDGSYTCSVDCFNTIFEGNGYTITGLATSRSNIDDIGMFGATGVDADIRRVGLVANLASYTGNHSIRIGGLVGLQQGGSITSSYATGDVNGGISDNNYAGGLVGEQRGGSITTSYATGAVDGGRSSSIAGGLVGHQSRGSITASYATGAVDSKNSFFNRTGGLVGNSQGTITASYATGNVDGRDGGNASIGGLVGWQKGGIITASYATGTVDGGSDDDINVGDLVGGLVGRQEGATITASYATGNVNGISGTASGVGGLVGYHFSGSITASYATGGVPEGTNIGKLVGEKNTTVTASASYGFGTGGTNTNSNPLPTEVTAANDLTADNTNPTWDDASFKTEGAWDFGTTSQAPALQYADYDGNGTDFACVGATTATGATTIYVPYCGGDTKYFLPGQGRTPFPAGTSPTPAGASALLGSFALVDQDHDGYIDINNLGALRNIIHNPEGTSYKTSATSQGRTTGCPSNLCQGYELTRNFSAAEVVSGAGLDHLLRNILTQDAVIKSNGYSIADLYLED